MDNIIELAERLGKAIAESPQAARLRKARSGMDAEQGTAKLMEDFQVQSDKMAHLEAENKPVEVEDKHKLQDLHQKLVASQAFKALAAAQVEYVDLMRKVHEALGRQLEATEGE